MAYRILVVEDDYTLLKLQRDILEIDGYKVIDATDGNLAIEKATRLKPDLIIMDIQMPVKNGLEATRAIKANPDTRHIPIIAVTALAMKGQDKTALEAGCDAYISKPFDVDVLGKKIRQFLPVNRN